MDHRWPHTCRTINLFRWANQHGSTVRPSSAKSNCPMHAISYRGIRSSIIIWRLLLPLNTNRQLRGMLTFAIHQSYNTVNFVVSTLNGRSAVTLITCTAALNPPPQSQQNTHVLSFIQIVITGKTIRLSVHCSEYQKPNRTTTDGICVASKSVMPPIAWRCPPHCMAPQSKPHAMTT